jgi:hypothetical protein
MTVAATMTLLIRVTKVSRLRNSAAGPLNRGIVAVRQRRGNASLSPSTQPSAPDSLTTAKIRVTRRQRAAKTRFSGLNGPAGRPNHDSLWHSVVDLLVLRRRGRGSGPSTVAGLDAPKLGRGARASSGQASWPRFGAADAASEHEAENVERRVRAYVIRSYL